MAEFHAFLAWITGRGTAGDAAARLGVGPREFARRTAWCWNVEPVIPRPAQAPACVMADGTYLPHGWCLLVLTDGAGTPLAWQWCGGEGKAAYRALFDRVPAPGMLTCDGGAGCRAAALAAWPGVRIQRCLVHVRRDTRTDLTLRPRTDAGRELKRLADALPRVRDATQAAWWARALNDWHQRWGEFIEERTYAKDDPDDPRARTARSWWWTHERTRRAYRRLERLCRDGSLFAFLGPGVAPDAAQPTTNRLEGGVNADIKRIVDAHRGLAEEHMRRCCEWVLYMKTPDPRPDRFVSPRCWQDAARPAARDDAGPLPGTWTAVQQPAPEEGITGWEQGFGPRKNPR